LNRLKIKSYIKKKNSIVRNSFFHYTNSNPSTASQCVVTVISSFCCCRWRTAYNY